MTYKLVQNELGEYGVVGPDGKLREFVINAGVCVVTAV